MQTLYYTTNNFVRHTGNVVDLSEYRRKLAQVQQVQEDWQPEEEPAAVSVSARVRRSDRCRRQALMLDACASMGIVVMTLTFTLHVLGL